MYVMAFKSLPSSSLHIYKVSFHTDTLSNYCSCLWWAETYFSLPCIKMVLDPVVASLPPKNINFSEGEKRRPEMSLLFARLRVVSHFSSGIVERAKRERAWKSPHARKGDSFFSLLAACRLFWRGVIFTRARVSLALLSLRNNGGLLVV